MAGKIDQINEHKEPSLPHDEDAHKIEHAYRSKPLAGSENSTNVTNAITNAVVGCCGFFGEPGQVVAIAIGFAKDLKDSGGSSADIAAALKAANIDQTVFEQNGVIAGIEMVLTTEDNHLDKDKLKTDLTNYHDDAATAVMTLAKAAQDAPSILHTQSFVYAAGMYLTLLGAGGYSRETIHKFIKEYLFPPAYNIVKSLVHGISGHHSREHPPGGFMAWTAGLNNPWIYTRGIHDKNHKLTFNIKHRSDRKGWFYESTEEMVETAINYVIRRSKIDTAIQGWHKIIHAKTEQ